jgi:hypothetical protein
LTLNHQTGARSTGDGRHPADRRASAKEPPALLAPTAPAPTGRLGRVRSGLVAAVTLLAATVAAIAYLVSFEAISAYVASIGALPAWLRWCGPLLVDTFITLGTLFLLWLALSGVPLRKVWDAWYAWALIAAATGASAYLNAAHAPARWDARLVAGAVPLALLASVHLLVLLLLRVLAWTPPATSSAIPAAAAVAPAEPAPASDRSAPLAAPQAGAIETRPQPRRAIGATRSVYDALADTGEPVTWQRFAAAFDPPMPRRTAQRHLATHHANGQRPPEPDSPSGPPGH